MTKLMQQPVVSQMQRKSSETRKMPPIVADVSWEEEASPYGLQGLAREWITIVKADCVTRLAIALALRGTSKQIRDPEFVSHIFLHHPEWLEEYHVVHLIEKSLWIQGRSDLVMTLTKNPSQIPDNPPPIVNQTLTEAYALHPQATVWYGVPLFGEEKTAKGLPIPVTAQELQAEADRRLRTAQQHALRWGWFYRMLALGASLPTLVVNEFVKTGVSLRNRYRRFRLWTQRLRSSSRRKNRAEFQARLDYCRTGEYSPVVAYQNMPWLDRTMLNGLDKAADVASVSGQILALSAPTAAGGWLAFMIHLSLFAPATLVSCDPFLFIELPQEPGKLRHLAHWYWQEHQNGKRTLHLHS
ncbi:hypothetical protein [uncultured Rubinisphaera sp.]|uniref:hypothetical protein n=1 Tax=uncultured Rubinisphaera sp. TaxID=1678686 RepID=UPI0030D6D898